MRIRGKIAVVTGAASGIGKALCLRFHREGAAGIIAVDIDEAAVARVAQAVKGIGLAADVAIERDVMRVVKETEDRYGRLDIFVSNAGILIQDPSHAASASNEDWEKIWHVNVMAHVYAARAVLPKMIARGGGYLVNTASAAGLLSQIGSAPYSVTKHAAVGFAEAISIAHHSDGIRVSLLCPQAVRTAMTAGTDGGVAGLDGMLEPEEVCDAVIDAIGEERFLVLPHPEVLTYMRRKTADYDRWLRGMRRLRDSSGDQAS